MKDETLKIAQDAKSYIELYQLLSILYHDSDPSLFNTETREARDFFLEKIKKTS